VDVRLHEADPQIVILVHPLAVEHPGHLVDETIPYPEQDLPPPLLLGKAAKRRREDRCRDLVRLHRLHHQLDLTERHELDVLVRKALPLQEFPDLIVERRAEGRQP